MLRSNLLWKAGSALLALGFAITHIGLYVRHLGIRAIKASNAALIGMTTQKKPS